MSRIRRSKLFLQKDNIVLTMQGIKKSYVQGNNTLNVLSSVDFEIKKGEVVALVGPSGCGKSTFLQIAGLLDTPAEGKLVITGVECEKANDAVRTKLRQEKIGFVYQYHHLLPEFSALENVILPQMIAGKKRRDAKMKAEEPLVRFGLSERLHHRPAELSGGEQQRVAIARALANDPAILLADEPTGNLDPTTAASVFKTLVSQVKQMSLAMLIVTHNLELARRADRVALLKNGRLVAT